MSTTHEISNAEWTAILAKMENIRELQNRAATSGEAEAAGAALTKLLTKYNLSMTEFEMRSPGQNTAPANTPIHQHLDLGNVAGWKRSLVNAIAMNTACRVVLMRGTTMVHIIGAPRNIDLVRDMYAQFEAIALNCANRAVAEQNADLLKVTVGLRKWKNAYMHGFASGLYDAMRAANKQAVDETPGGSALVLVSDRALARAVNDFVGPTRATHSPSYNADAFRKGAAAGRDAGSSTKRLNG